MEVKQPNRAVTLLAAMVLLAVAVNAGRVADAINARALAWLELPTVEAPKTGTVTGNLVGWFGWGDVASDASSMTVGMASGTSSLVISGGTLQVTAGTLIGDTITKVSTSIPSATMTCVAVQERLVCR